MKDSTLYFVTSNSKKYASLSTQLKSLGIDLKQLEFDFDEGRELNIESITSYKLSQAKQKFPDKKLIVDDRGFFIPALNGFPGPFVKLLLNSFSYNGVIKLMNGITDRRAMFSYAIGYFDGQKDTILVTDEVGFITESPNGDNLHGLTDLLYIYGHPSFPNRSLAELSDDEWQDYLKATEDIDSFVTFVKLKNYLSEQNTTIDT